LTIARTTLKPDNPVIQSDGASFTTSLPVHYRIDYSSYHKNPQIPINNTILY